MTSFLRQAGAFLGLVLFGISGSLSVAAAPAASDWIEYGQGRIRLISAPAGVADGTIRLGLQYDIEPGWEIYWRSPGEAGYPTTIDWTGTENIVDAEIFWPVPGRFQIFGLDTFGYKGEVVLPIEGRILRPNEAAQIRAAVNFLTCQETCVPHDVVLSLDLPGGAGGVSEHARLINRYWAKVPKSDPAVGLRVARTELVATGENPLLQVIVFSESPFRTPDVFVEGPQNYIFAPPDVRLSESGGRAVFHIPISLAVVQGEGPPPDLLGGELTITLVDQGRAIEQTLTTVLGQAEATSFMPIVLVLALAFLGGLILNVMPCVLPVLSIKLMGVMNHGGGDQRHVRNGFLASSAGIVFAFLVLAAGLIALKYAGAAVGWGIQFQQPLFIAAMTVLITLFAANMWGLFELSLPQWISGLALRGGGERRSDGLVSSFGTGVFATILATPCSAPFFGTAIGFALARGAFEIGGIFAALGLGMALPYLVLAAFPGLATRLPRPGAWMVTVKKVLGVALAGTAVWLISIFAFQVSTVGAVTLAAIMVAAIGVLWARQHVSAAVSRFAPVAVAALAVVALATSGMVPRGFEPPKAGPTDWAPFDEAAIPGLVAEGKIVFVDVTAEWCVTCLVNKRLVLDRGEVARILAREDVVAMQADWTNPDESIAAYLARNNRFGIPFNIIYGPVAPNGLILPELLTRNVVMQTFDAAAGRILAAGS